MTHFIKYRDDILTQSVTHVVETLSAITFIHDENINVNIQVIIQQLSEDSVLVLLDTKL